MGDVPFWTSVREHARILWHGLTAGSTRDFYDSYSGHYDTFFESQRVYAADTRAILKDLLAEGDITLSAVLECGCGTGIYSAELETICERLYGVDFSVGQLDEAQEKDLSIALTQGDVLSLPFPKESIDLVASLGMLRHLPGEMMDHYFEEAYRVLRPGGMLLTEPMVLDLFTLSNPRFGRLLTGIYNTFMRVRGLDEYLGVGGRIGTTLHAAGFAVERFRSEQTYTYDVVVGRKL